MKGFSFLSLVQNDVTEKACPNGTGLFWYLIYSEKMLGVENPEGGLACDLF
jgi:hypothetical protein